jgi:hypothetical protein
MIINITSSIVIYALIENKEYQKYGTIAGCEWGKW